MTDTAIHTYAYDAANRLTNADGGVYTWDGRGNLLSDGTFTYTYSAAGRLVQAQSLTATLVYTYNADGLRVARSQSVASVESVDTFTWDWATGVPELLSDGDSLYLIGYDTLGWQSGMDWTFVLPDALGSVRQETDAAGAVTAAREWSPYGEEIGGAQTGLGFTGEWFDAAVGLTYLRARWYDGGTGRFTQRDPLVTSTFYRYASNNPVNWIDPSGYLAWTTCAIQGDYGMCTIEKDDWYYKIARVLIAAGIQGDVGQLADQLYALNSQRYPNRDIIPEGGTLTLPKEWIQAVLNSQYPPPPATPPPATPSLLPYLLPIILREPEESCAPTPPQEICPACPKGYLEGIVGSATANLYTFQLEGLEVVYDFVNLRRAWFRFTGEGGISSNVFDLNGTMYVGFVWGFRKDVEGDPAGVNNQYAGRSIGVSFGAAFPVIPAVIYAGTGLGGFSSSPGEWPGNPNWDIWGITQYYAVGSGTAPYDNPVGGAAYTAMYDLPLA